MATNTTFSYSTSTGGSTYEWSNSSNWTNGVPNNLTQTTYGVTVGAGPAGAISLDNIAQALTIDALSVASGGTVEIASGDTLIVQTVLSGVSGSGAGTVILGGTGAEIDFSGASQPLPSTVALDFTAGAESVVFGAFTSGSDAGAVSGVTAGDSFDFQSFTTINSDTVANGTLTISGSYNLSGVQTSGAVQFTNYSGATTFSQSTDSQGGIILTATCYAAGTRLLTPTGERAVEDLREGDLILTQHGDALVPSPVTWVGQLRVDLARHPRPETAAPIRIRRGAFADDIPHRDLLLSPEHCLFADGKLVAAKSLVNGATIVQDFAVPAIQYFHIETSPHAIVLAEGLPAETYLDTGNRAIFDNAGHALLLHPEFHINTALRGWETDACAPLATTAEQIAPIWHRLAARAQALGHTLSRPETTTDAAPRLLIAGRELAPLAATAQTLTFLLPPGTGEIALASRHGAPTDTTPWCNDHRRLGLAVTGITLRAPTGEQRIRLDSPAFGPGWHAPEQAEGAAWRWTDGRGILRLPETAGRTVLEIHLGSAMTYRVDPPARDRRAA